MIWSYFGDKHQESHRSLLWPFNKSVLGAKGKGVQELRQVHLAGCHLLPSVRPLLLLLAASPTCALSQHLTNAVYLLQE